VLAGQGQVMAFDDSEPLAVWIKRGRRRGAVGGILGGQEVD